MRAAAPATPTAPDARLWEAPRIPPGPSFSGVIRRRSSDAEPAAAGWNRLGIQEQGGGLDRSDSVHQAVVGLADERPTSSGQPFEDDEIPERTAAVEPLREVVGRPIEQLASPRRARASAERRTCAADVEAGVGLPRRPAQAARPRLREPLAVARQHRQATLEVTRHAPGAGAGPSASASKTITPPMCIWALSSASSSSRKVASSAVSRSVAPTRGSSHHHLSACGRRLQASSQPAWKVQEKTPWSEQRLSNDAV